MTFNTLIHKFKKHQGNLVKLNKIDKKTTKLLSLLRANNLKNKNERGSSKASSRKQSNASSEKSHKISEKKKSNNDHRKSVKFNEDVEMREFDNNVGSRTWNDSKNKNLVKGKFSDEEVKILMNSLCSYVK